MDDIDELFKSGNISSREYVESFGIHLKNAKAGVSPTGEIEITTNKYFSWEKPEKQLRNTPKYVEWRTKVFERDNYTCQHCGIRGGNLNAHHIKPWKKYIKLRFIVGNGITLCEKCHREEHKQLRKESVNGRT